MNKTNLRNGTIILFIVLATMYYFVSFGAESDKTFLTISTFLFSIFAGFFVARQGRRYSAIRKEVAGFDGIMSFIYRVSGHLGATVQVRTGDILKKHYGKIVETKSWDYHFTHKSSTLTSIHETLEEHIGDTQLANLKSHTVNRMLAVLSNAQIARKQMVALYQERVPHFQWTLIYFFLIILLATVSTLPSVGFLLGAILKSAFAVSVISVMVILHKLDNLSFFEGTIGEHSAQDVVDIIEGTK